MALDAPLPTPSEWIALAKAALTAARTMLRQAAQQSATKEQLNATADYIATILDQAPR